MTPTPVASRLRIYAITPDALPTDAIESAVRVAIRAGVTAVQFRDKSARTDAERAARLARVAAACRAEGAWLVVNDDPELALDFDADAVHVGPNDLPVERVRAIVGPGMAIGASAGTVERAIALVGAGADYLGVGAIFDASGTKPDASRPRGVEVLRALRATPALARVPIVAIGGVTTAERARACIDAGADGVAATRALLGAPDVEAAVGAFVRAIGAR